MIIRSLDLAVLVWYTPRLPFVYKGPEGVKSPTGKGCELYSSWLQVNFEVLVEKGREKTN